jgi:hypothetical protein
MFTFQKRAKLAVAVGAAVVAGGLTLALGVASAGAQQVAGQAKTPPGDNGDVKVHNSTTPVTDERNEPHVCVFYLDAFNFDPAQSVSWWIKSWPPTGNRSVVDTGTITLDSSGNGATADQTLPNGHYKLFWTFAGEKGSAKQKVFWVSCSVTPPTTPPPTTPPPTTTPPTTPPPTSPPPTTTSPSPSPTSTVPPSASAPTPVQTNLPVTG